MFSWEFVKFSLLNSVTGDHPIGAKHIQSEEKCRDGRAILPGLQNEKKILRKRYKKGPKKEKRKGKDTGNYSKMRVKAIDSY